MSARIDIKKTQKIVAIAMEKIKAEVDPWLLDEYHRLFKKEVSLFHRSRVAAYLLMLAEQGKTPRLFEHGASEPAARQKGAGRNGAARPERGGSRKSKTGDGSCESQDAMQRYPLAEEDSRWLFFSAGRSRRISPREILGLINTKTALPKEDIGAIRILDHYSFVQVRDTAAEKIIDAMNGYVFRGRALAINYAKSRGEGGGAAEGRGDLPDSGDFPAPAHIESEDDSFALGAEAGDSDQDGGNRPEEKDV